MGAIRQHWLRDRVRGRLQDRVRGRLQDRLRGRLQDRLRGGLQDRFVIDTKNSVNICQNHIKSASPLSHINLN